MPKKKSKSKLKADQLGQFVVAGALKNFDLKAEKSSGKNNRFNIYRKSRKY